MLQLIGIIGVVLVIISYFLTWGTQTFIVTGDKINFTSIDFLNRGMWLEGTNNFNSWENEIPRATFIIAIVALIILMIPGISLGSVATDKVFGIASIVISIVLLSITVLFMIWFTGIELITFSYKLGIGAYLCLIGSILFFVFSIMSVLKEITA